MERDLIQKLQKEAGLSYEQAEKVVDSVREYILEKQGDPDWDSFLKNKASDLAEQAKEAGENLTQKLSEFKNKAVEKIDDISDKAQDKINDLRSRAADFIAPDKSSGR